MNAASIVQIILSILISPLFYLTFIDLQTSPSSELNLQISQGVPLINFDKFLEFKIQDFELISLRDDNVSMNGVRILGAKEQEALVKHSKYMSLNGIENDDYVSHLARKKSGGLRLDGLKKITEKNFESFAQHRGPLSLGGLGKLPPGFAKALARHKGDLYLDSITNLSKGDLDEFIDFNYQISLKSLSVIPEFSNKENTNLTLILKYKKLDQPMIQKLVQLKNKVNLHLDYIDADSLDFLFNNKKNCDVYSLNQIDHKIAMVFKKHKKKTDTNSLKTIDELSLSLLIDGSMTECKLNGLQSISNDLAWYLGNKYWLIELNGLKSLSKVQAALLGNHPYELHLNGLTELSPDAALGLSKCFGALYLNGLKKMDPKTAHHMSNKFGYLSLNSLSDLSDECLEELGTHAGILKLNGLKSLSDFGAESLSNHVGPLHLNSLSSISDSAFEKLLEKSKKIDWELYSNVEQFQACVPTIGLREGLFLDGLVALTDSKSKAISEFKNDLSLNSIETITDSQAKNIGSFNSQIYLNNIKSLNNNQAKCISRINEKVSLDGIVFLNDPAFQDLLSGPAKVSLMGLSKINENNISFLIKNKISCYFSSNIYVPEELRKIAQENGVYYKPMEIEPDTAWFE